MKNLSLLALWVSLLAATPSLRAQFSIAPLTNFGGGIGWLLPGENSFLTTDSTERGLAYGNGHLYLVSRAGGLINILVLDPLTGDVLDGLDTTGISGGTFPVNMVCVGGDGAIYVNNLHTQSDASPLKVYKWASEASVPTVVYSGDGGLPGARIGDSMAVIGTGSSTRLALGYGNSPSVSGNNGYTIVDPTAGTATAVAFSGTPPSAGDFRLGITFSDASHVIGSQGSALYRYTGFSGTTGTLLASPVLPDSRDRLLAYAVVGEVPLLAVLNTGDSQVSIYDVSNPASPVLLGTGNNTANLAANTNGTGQLAWGDIAGNTAHLWAMSCNQGIQAFTVVAPTLAITTQPQSQAVNLGSNATFCVTASGMPPLSYEWRFNGTTISDATNTCYTHTNAQCANAGNYAVVVTNSFGSVTSSVAALTVVAPPAILTQPTARTNNVGQPATFTVTATNDCGGGLAYQWRFNGTGISGATDSSFTRTSVQCANAGNYDVVVTNLAGSVTSSVAALTVTAPPGIFTQPANQTVSSGQSATFTVTTTNGCGDGLTYQWRFNGADISGATDTSYTHTNAQCANAGNYDVVVTNTFGSVTSSVAALTVVAPPAILTQPTNQTNYVGQPATFTVTATNDCGGGLTHQWKKDGGNLSNGGNVSGATSPALALSSVQLGDMGSYTVVVTNLAGSITSVVATLTVIDPEIAVEQPTGTNLTDSTASVDFGSALVAGSSQRTFTIRNIGSTDLTGLGITIDGTNASDFTVTANPTAPISASGSTTFTVTFTPNAVGDRTAALHIASNDSDESPFDITLTGGGLTRLQFAQEAYLKASNPGGEDNLGWSVALSGNTLVVGAYGEDSNATGVNGDQNDNSAVDSGVAYVFVRDGTTWTQQAYLKASNTEAGDGFGASVAISGDTIVIGANGEDSNATGVNGDGANNSAASSGAAYVFVRNGTTWSQQAYLKASNTGGDQFGISVAVSEDTAVVGAFGEASNATGVNGNESNNSAPGAGAAYVFVRSGTNWSQQAYLKASNTGAGDNFGLAVAVSGDTAVVGAENEESNATGVNGNQGNNTASEAGAAYVFVRSGETWSQQAYLKASNTTSFDDFGNAVSISGDTIVVGSPLEDFNAVGVNGEGTNNLASASGAAYVFVRSGATWSQQAYLKASNPDISDLFGKRVSVSGNLIVVGADGEDSNATGINGDESNNGRPSAGAAYVFVRQNGDWTQHNYLKASNTEAVDNFGLSVAVSGDTVVAGAPFEDSSATGVNGDQNNNSLSASGAAYVFTGLISPAIITQPQTQTVLANGDATFTVAATGTQPLSYQWRFNGADISGATGTSFTRAAAQVAHTGDHSVVVTNSAGSVTSVVATLTVLTPPSITAQPQSRTNLAGTTATFNVTATGDAPLSYQWRFNGADISGATQTNYILGNAQYPNAGGYSVVVTNASGSVTSVVATLTVVPRGTVGTGKIVLTGDEWAFSDAGFANNSAYITNVVTWFGLTTNSAGKTALILDGQSGNCGFNGTCGAFGSSFRSQLTTMGVSVTYLNFDSGLVPLAGYDAVFAAGLMNKATTLTNDLVSFVAGGGAVYLAGGTGTFSPANPTGEAAYWHPFLSAATGTNGLELYGGSFWAAQDPPLHFAGPIGEGAASLDWYLGQGVQVGSEASAAIWDSQRNLVATWSAILPVITAQPQSRTNVAGTTATFSVLATNTSPLSYQWQRGGTNLSDGGNISGATTSMLTLTNVQSADAGNYSVIVTNLAGSVTSSNAVLTVNGPPTITAQPQSRTNGLGTMATFSVEATGVSSLTYQWRRNEMDLADGGRISGATSSALTLSDAQFADAGDFAVVVSQIGGSVTSAVATLTVLAPDLILDNTNAAVTFAGTWQIDTSAAGRFGPDYRVASTNSGPGTSHATYTPNIPADGNYDVYIWYPEGSNRATNAQWLVSYNGDSVLTPVNQQINGGGWLLIASNKNFSAGTGGFVQLSNGSNTTTGVVIADAVRFAYAGLPNINVHPQSQTNSCGDVVSFNVIASGKAPLSYQWQFDGVNISGATSDIYTRTNAPPGDYSVIVSNSVGSVTSTVATLTVLMPVIVSGLGTIFEDNFESGNMTNWTPTAGSPLGNFTEANAVPDCGQRSAKAVSESARMHRNLIDDNGGEELAGAFRFTSWIWDSGSSGTLSGRFYNELRAYSDSGLPNGGATANGSLQQLLAIGKNRAGTLGFGDASFDPTKYQGRVNFGAGAGWFNLNNPGAPSRSPGWHKFEIEQLADGATLKFSVDGILSRTVTNPTPATFDTLILGPGVGSNSDTAYFDGIRLEISPPTITTHPEDRTNIVGTTATFSVTATGASPLSYQWQKGGTNLSDGGNITGTTNSMLTLTNVQLAAAGDYSVVVTNVAGSVTSAIGVLTVQIEFTDFATQYSLPPGQDDPGDDADGDGLLNVFEFYLGSDPTDTGSGAEPSGKVVSDSGQEYPAITFVRSKSAGGVTLITEVSSDVNFTDSLNSVLESVENLGDGTERVTIRSAVSSSAQNPQFLRIRLSQP